MIFFISRSIPITVAGLLLALSSPTTTAAIDAQPHRHINVAPGQSIADEVRNAHANGILLPEFTLRAENVGSETIYEVEVREAQPAVTSKTTVSFQGGESKHVDEDALDTLLVSNTDGTVALIAVEKKGGKVDGIIVRGEESVKFTQSGGQKAFARIADTFVPPPWDCGVGADEEVNAVDRFLFEDGHDDHHDPSDQDHSGHNHHDHSHDFDPSKTENALADLKHSLRGSEVHIGKRRRVQDSPYKFWVDIYLEIDRDLCEKKGDSCADGTIGKKTLNYVNTIITGANTIYESEIDTHLNVLHINLNTNYAAETDTSNALNKMVALWGRPNGEPWHYISSTGVMPDLHHALLGMDLGGGIAYRGVICRPDYGFGLSTNLSGGYVSMSNAVVWDMFVVMHELGHNFNSHHTHDSSYSPVIDTCGTSCPAELPLAKSSTIMSFCQFCDGSYSNIDYTFGGKYNSGPRDNVTSYTRSHLQGSISDDPQRVNVVMWNHVASGLCANIYTTSVPSATPTTGNPTISSKPTQAPTCIATGGQCNSTALCCSGVCPLSGQGKNKCGSLASASPTGQPTVPGATGAPTNACTGVGGVCTTAASCCSNNCPAKGRNAGKCVA